MSITENAHQGVRKVPILLGTLAHRRLTNTFKDIPPPYESVAVSARHIYPVGGDLGMSSLSLTSVRDVIGRIPRIRNLVKWGPDQHLFGLESVLADADIVLAHGASALYSGQAARFCERTGRPLIIQEVALFTLRDTTDRFYASRRQALASARIVVAVTERAKTALLLEGVPAEKIRVIPYGIDTELFHPDACEPGVRERLGLAEGQLVVLCVGYIRWNKGVFDLVHAAKLLADDPALRRCDLHLVFVGGGVDRAALQERINNLGLANRCHLVGSVGYDQMPAVYAASDIVVAPSIPGRYTLEQWCLVLSEAMATGVPVMATYCGGMPEVIGDAGVLVQPADPYSLAAELGRLALDAEARAACSASGLQRVKELYDSRIVGRQYADLFDEVLSD